MLIHAHEASRLIRGTPNAGSPGVLAPLRRSGPTGLTHRWHSQGRLLITDKLGKAAPSLQHSCCLSVDPDVPAVCLARATARWCQPTPGGLQSHPRRAGMPALLRMSRGVFDPSGTVLSFYQAMSSCQGLGCPLVLLTREQAQRIE